MTQFGIRNSPACRAAPACACLWQAGRSLCGAGREFGIFKAFIPHSPFPIPHCLIPLAFVLCFLGGERASGETANRIVAIVNDDIITQADVAEQLSQLLEDPQMPQPRDADVVAVQQVLLQRLIEQRLILQEARQAGLSVASDDVADRIDMLRSRFSSEEEFQQSLEDSQLSMEQLKEKIREQLMVQRIIDLKVRATIVVSPREVASTVGAPPETAGPGERVRALHLLVRAGDTRSEADARALIEDLSRQLRTGADFSTLAKRYSEDPHAGAGGVMGWVAQGELLPELDEALFRLKPGEVSSPIQSRLGFHLVKVEERRVASAADLALPEANHAAYQQLYQQKFEAAMKRWLGELKRNAYIEIPRDS